uniref:Holin n=1 Tax=Siphoviridae sp. ct9lR64 TaxID=2826178 RepID=A0A8S5QYI8_9CAUD|nr:MAG TPA: holin [Siphoviridae sp. ct9lR64]
MKLNWTVRLKNKTFWMTVIPAVFVLIKTVAGALGFELNLGTTESTILQVVDVIFVVLAALGVIVDPTTAGISDSARAMTYTHPSK